MTLLRNAALLLCILTICAGAVESPVPAPGDEPVELITLPLDGANKLPLPVLLEFASKTLGFPILFNAADAEGCVFDFTAPVSLPRSEFQNFFERLLLEKGFLYVENGEGKSAMHRVVLLKRGMGQLTTASAKCVLLEDLKAYSTRGILVTFCVPLKHVMARESFQMLSNMINQGGPSAESIRAVDNANVLVITTFGHKAWQMASLLKILDREPDNDFAMTSRQTKTLLSRIASLEKRLAALEKSMTPPKKR
jgi:hypothetical protein